MAGNSHKGSKWKAQQDQWGQNFKVKQEISKDKLNHDMVSTRGLASVAKHEVIRDYLVTTSVTNISILLLHGTEGP